MIVICIAECEKKALPKTRRILCQYLPQIGSRTWIGKISEEGLQDLYQALRKGATKQSAIACHRVRGTKRTELQWIIGSRDNFDEIGSYAYSTLRGKELVIYKNLSRPQKILRIILQLAALFHDLGKATLGFQKKLASRKPQSDAIRHEYISCLMLAQILKDYDDKEDNHWLELFCDSDKLTNFFSSKLENGISKQAIKNKLFYIDQINKKPLRIWVLWLVLTHHQLPDGEKENIKFLEYPLFNNKDEKSWQDFLKLADGEKPWENKQWLHSVSDLCSQLLNELKPTIQELADLAPYVLYLARPCLVYGDYLASSKREKSAKSFEENTNIYANSLEDKPADTLTIHLLAAKSWSRRYFMCTHDYERHLSQLQFTDISTLPDFNKDIRINRRLANDKFAWQQDAINKILQQDPQQQPFFGIIIAGTGTGKTRAAAKIMAALGNNLRYTLGLGLRTLTLQTGQAYHRDLKIPKSECAIIVGQAIPQELADSLENKDSEIQEKDGIGNFSLDILNQNQYVEAVAHDQENDELFNIVKRKEKEILRTPILVTTVDHIIRSAELIRSRESLMMLRIMTADLVLDEIDSYNPEDLNSLGKLVYLSGLFGKKVMLLSATLSPVIAEAFYAAYELGLKQHANFNEKIFNKPLIGLFSNHYECSSVAKLNETDFSLHYRKFIKFVTNCFTKEQPKHRCEILENKAKDNSLDYPAILNACFDLHKINSNLIDNINISIGFVRWNTVKQCRNFAAWLYDQQQPEGIQFAIICYHARLTLLDRYKIENFLDKTLNRKNPLQNILVNSSEVKAVIQKAQQLNKKHVVLIVVTNPIQETGRDHDYDWAILEPCSTRSIIQSAGRVRRHREIYLKENNFNIYLMRYPTSYLENRPTIWSMPGIESPSRQEFNLLLLNSFNISEHRRLIGYLEKAGIQNVPQEPNTKKIICSDEAFDMKQLKQIINAQLCLVTPTQYSTSPITALEYTQLFYLLRNEKEFFSLWFFLNEIQVQLNRDHAKTNRFRQSNGISCICYPTAIENGNYNRWYEILEKAEHSYDWINHQEVNSNNALLKYDLETIFTEIANELNLSLEDYQAHRILGQIEIPPWMKDKARTKGFIYHPLLGLGIK